MKYFYTETGYFLKSINTWIPVLNDFSLLDLINLFDLSFDGFWKVIPHWLEWLTLRMSWNLVFPLSRTRKMDFSQIRFLNGRQFEDTNWNSARYATPSNLVMVSDERLGARHENIQWTTHQLGRSDGAPKFAAGREVCGGRSHGASAKLAGRRRRHSIDYLRLLRTPLSLNLSCLFWTCAPPSAPAPYIPCPRSYPPTQTDYYIGPTSHHQEISGQLSVACVLLVLFEQALIIIFVIFISFFFSCFDRFFVLLFCV